ncbi:hypothetical protein GCM10023114_31420 [Mycolicibacterium sediminis]|uniref:Uncharacterized protein n=1 Tax=Mycolicibacterium sediminis TaxID=1286180 RepID=A0A7I7QK84_9MYCO|nr:hypothetical protein MSEDJ_07710 [Mycolicibacterium sediminis]
MAKSNHSTAFPMEAPTTALRTAAGREVVGVVVGMASFRRWLWRNRIRRADRVSAANGSRRSAYPTVPRRTWVYATLTAPRRDTTQRSTVGQGLCVRLTRLGNVALANLRAPRT